MGVDNRFGAPPDADPDATVVLAPQGRTPQPDDDATVVLPRPAAAALGTAAPPPTPAPQAPSRPGGVALPPKFRLLEYRIDRVLGQGGFGITYLATDVHLNAKVAIKEYLPESIAFRATDASVSVQSSRHRDRYRSGLENFLVEARTLAAFRHPNIVRVARFFEAHRTAYMVLEYERGQPLKAWWAAQTQPPAEAELVRLLQPLFDGIAVLHGAGVLHRDIKPDNIQVRADDGSLVLLDFGSAQQAADASQAADIIVTPGFAPIEQYGVGDQGPWTDLYALGATLYALITGRRPPDAEARQAAVDPMTPAVEAARGRYGEPFLAAIDWALQRDAAQRPPDMAAWQQALFADHPAARGLHEALQAHEGGAADKRRRRRPWHERLRALVSPAAWPLAAKMTIAMVLTALLPMVITGSYNLQGSLATVSQAELQNLEQLARSTAGRLAQRVDDGRKLARVLASDTMLTGHLHGPPDDAALPALRTRLQAVVEADPDIQLVMLMDAAGLARVSNDPAVMGRNFAFREYFRAAMAGRAHVTGIVVGAVAGQAGMFFAEPVRNTAGEVVGCVVLRLYASAVASILDEVQAGSTRTPFLVDGDGVLIYHPRENLLYRSLAPLPPERAQALRADQRFRRDRIEHLQMPALAGAMVGARAPGHLAYDSTITAQREVVGYAPVAGHDWVVGVTEPQSEFEAPLKQLNRQLWWSALLIGLLFTGLALRFARSIVRPIQALTGAADALRQGELDRVQIEATARDEIGGLQRTFQVMVDVLRQRERERRRGTSSASGNSNGGAR